MTNAHIRDDYEPSMSLFDMVAESAAARRMLQQVHMLATCDQVAILLEGESGTGKSQLARYIHSLSRRAAKPFQMVMLSTLDDAIASSDLFGHVRGAFTDARHSRAGHFVETKGGSLFLDEIGKASRAVQGKLLHAIEYKEITPVGADRAIRVDARIIAATNIPLEVLVERGTFLPDLEARFGQFRLRLPSLRERRADIPDLVACSIQRHHRTFGYATPPAVCPELGAALKQACWPKNLRELDGAIQYLLMSANGAPILTLLHCTDRLSHLATDLRRRTGGQSPERTQEVVAQSGGKTQAALVLGVHRTTVHRRLRRLREESNDSARASAGETRE